jgi:hypothetical protein
VTGIELADRLSVEPTGRHVLNDGRAGVVASYCLGPNPVLAVDVQTRVPGSGIWYTQIAPVERADGPTYRIPSSVAASFGLVTVPRVPDRGTLTSEVDAYGSQMGAAEILAAGEGSRIIAGTRADLDASLAGAPSVVASAAGAAAATAVRAVTAVVGGAAGAFYGALPLWVQVGIPVAVVAVGVAGAVAVVRSFRPGSGIGQ